MNERAQLSSASQKLFAFQFEDTHHHYHQFVTPAVWRMMEKNERSRLSLKSLSLTAQLCKAACDTSVRDAARPLTEALRPTVIA